MLRGGGAESWLRFPLAGRSGVIRTLRIRNLVIIEELCVEFGPGLNLLTGETGAGKSIVVDALGLAAGARADRSLVREGAEQATVEALFEMADDPALSAWARERGLEIDDGQVLVRRELSAAGNNRIYLNGSPCTLSLLRELGQRGVELHGQHEQQTLLSPDRHLDLVDRHAGHGELLSEVAAACKTVRGARERVQALREQRSERTRRSEELAATVREIDAVEPRPGELAELDRERHVLRNAETMVELLDAVVTLSYDGEPAACGLAATAARKASKLAELDPDLETPARRLASAALELQETGAAFRDYRDRGEFNRDRLEEVEARRASIERLCLRYGENEEALLRCRDEARETLRGLEDVDASIETAQAGLVAAEDRYASLDAGLCKARRVAADRLIPEVEAQFKALALDKARLRVEFSNSRGTAIEREGREPLTLSSGGSERAEFLLAANPGEPFRPLVRVASGGELSRVMLALLVVVDGGGDGRVLVFDEVDAGIGGPMADALGARLARLARRHQVLCVTHLAQVAAHADRHLVVHKRVVRDRTVAGVTALSGDARVDELAKMLGGRRLTDTSRRHASEMLLAAGQASRRKS